MDKMQIRFLNQNEIQLASNVVTGVYNTCVLPYTQNPLDVEQFRAYVNPGYLMQEMMQGRLFMWGVFEDGQLCAVGAMQNVGHITLLYTNPYYQRRGYATLLMNTMRMHALSALRLQRITVNVLSAQLAPFFYKRGFYNMQGVVNGGAYISMESQLTAPYGAGTNYVPMPPQKKPKKKIGVTYTTRKISNKAILITVGVVFFLLFVIGIGYTMSHLLTV